MKKQIKITEQDSYLIFPIQAEQDKTPVLLYIGDTILTEVQIPVGKVENGKYEADYLAAIPICQYTGKMLTLVGNVPEEFMNAVHTDVQVKNSEVKRPHIHFTPQYGWMNDPNGLVYYEGQYHMYFQYNPFDTQWDNMSWGHAVSDDLLHWHQKDTTLLPDEDGMIFSGCGLVNKLGKMNLPEDSLLFFYTAAGGINQISKEKLSVQKMAYSLDKGNTLIKMDKAVVPTICKENRDPKIFWHEETKAYIMCLWLEENDFAILRSVDLENWELSQRLTLQKGFECPDLFQLPVSSGGSKWVFWCADGYYYMGDFDGYQFITDGNRKSAYKTKLPYAAQTISNLDGRVISIPWLRTNGCFKRYRGAMGIPREFSLIEKNGEWYVSQQPIEELIASQNEIAVEKQEKNNWIKLEQNKECAIKIDTILTITEQSILESMEWHIYQNKIVYHPLTGILMVGETVVNIGEGLKDFSIIFDKAMIEITAGCGIIYAVFEAESKEETGDISIKNRYLEQVKVYEIL
ncbi:glycoside hydrolase family 32 protein [Anaeromicropila populeti]|uniref:Fructan beta-fructosidase n=1 Tax=Anaeromicropila populeti TaxID=37658 RepID=A0A1I6HVD1_9FIRM|nr:glycoside hydrolase family 32 protein [Anaeromicropila populeti]SFR58160.1 fructan beta-fructosidase [Anaeromicropila populeti]